ncbi:N-acetylneuraminate synthase family protein [Candidatus Omnitrophota bacterium]
MMQSIQNSTTDDINRVFVIAEIGLNHGGDMDKAKALIDSAVRANVDAVKFQTYITEKRAPKGHQQIYDILKECELPFKYFQELKEYSERKDVLFFSTPFDIESLDYLDKIGCTLFKIASFDVGNKDFLLAVAQKHKAAFLSTGMATEDEIREACNIFRMEKTPLTLLHCISAYPLSECDANLKSINTLASLFKVPVGYSDHTAGIDVSLLAVSVGARVIEKHYKINEEMDCVDAAVSITEDQMKQLVHKVRKLEIILGSGKLGPKEVEKPVLIFKRVTGK